MWCELTRVELEITWLQSKVKIGKILKDFLVEDFLGRRGGRVSWLSDEGLRCREPPGVLQYLEFLSKHIPIPLPYQITDTRPFL